MTPSHTRIALCAGLSLASPLARADAVDELLRARCAADPRLALAAGEVLAARDPARPLDASRLRALAESSGVAAPSVHAALVRGGTDRDRAEALARWFSTRSGLHASARCAALTLGEHTALALVPRLAEVAPALHYAGVGGWVHQTVSLPADALGAALVVTRPDGSVTRAALGSAGVSLRLDAPGEHTLQVTADSGQGTLAWATWHLTAGRPAAPSAAADEALESPRALVAAINALRREAGAAPLRADPSLAAVAGRYARALAEAGAVGHGAGEDSPVGRMRAAHLHARRVAENVVRAPSLTEAHARLRASPSHRANLLDAALDAVGVGVCERPEGVYVVELFAAQPAIGD